MTAGKQAWILDAVACANFTKLRYTRMIDKAPLLPMTTLARLQKILEDGSFLVSLDAISRKLGLSQFL